MLRGHVFVAAPDVPPDVRSLVVASGGRVVSSLDSSVTAGLVLRGGECQLSCSHHLRGLRIPVLRTSWVRASVAAGRLLPMKFPHVEYDPMLLDGLRITTTLLPHDVKKRVAAVIQFCGGTYSPHLTNYTDILIHGDCGDITSNAERTMKWRCAWGRGVACTPLGWLQDCIASGRRIDLPPSSPPPSVLPTLPPPPSLATSLMSPAAAATETTTIKTETMWTQKSEEEDESSCGSSHEAAGKKKCDSSPSLSPGTKYQKGSHVDNTVHSGCNAGKAISLLPSKGEIWENLFKDFFNIVSEYVEHMLPSDNAMKVLLVDEATLHIISTACSQTFLLKKGVFLVSRIEHHQRKLMKRMHCVVFIRPQISSVEAVCEELRNAKYESYAIHFSNTASTEMLDRLARADVDCLVNRVGEAFCDFEVCNADAFVSVVPAKALLPAFLSAVAVQRIAEGIAATFVALRRRPYIRFYQNSDFSRRLASELGEILSKNMELYNFKNKDSVLLIVDRSSDVLTPLLTPWTYQAMLHEYIGLQHNRLHFSGDASAGKEKEEGEEYVFSQQDDAFFAANMFSNWGELCNNVKMYVDKFKSTLNIDRSTATMEEIKEFMQRLPQTKTLTGSVTKHATVVSHLSSIIKKRELLDISLLEQDMISSPNANDHWNRLQVFAAKRRSGHVDTRDFFRLCLIYHLRYEKPDQSSRVLQLLESIDHHHASYMRKLEQYSGGERSVDDLFGPTGVMASIVKTFVDVGNIYTQHEPVIKRTLLQLFGGRLSTEHYPYLTSPPVASSSSSQFQQQTNFRPKEALVFMCGGFTYEEAALVNAINASKAYTGSAAGNLPQGGVSVSIGGTAVLNSETFLSLLSTLP